MPRAKDGGRRAPVSPKVEHASAIRVPSLAYLLPEPADEGVISGIVDVNDPNPLGGATADELRSVALEKFGEGPELDAPQVSIGIEAAARAISARRKNADSVNDPKGLAVFLVSDRARELAAGLSAELQPIIDNGSVCFAGFLWITSPVFRSGYCVSFSSGVAAEVFGEINKRGLGGRPALVFDPNSTEPELRFYPSGLDEPDHVQRMIIAEQFFSMEALDRVLTRFHETNIITPDAAMPDQSPWRDAAQYIPRHRVEAFLQAWIKGIFNIAFDEPYKIDFEIPGTEGRCDLLVASRHPTDLHTWVNHAVLELKVLRSRTSGGKAVSMAARVRAVTDGLVQAIAYKSERDTEHGMLCCFDMRLPKHCDGDGCLEAVRLQADQNNIELRRYRLYGSSVDMRADRYAGSSRAKH